VPQQTAQKYERFVALKYLRRDDPRLAERLLPGLGRSTVYRRMKALGIDG